MTEENKNLETDIVKALLADRRQDRRWRNIRFFFYAFIIIALTILLFSPSKPDFNEEDLSNKPYVSFIHLEGVIMPGTEFSAARVLPQLKKAFADKKSKGVVIVINSPGGSPVQSTIIHDKILQLKQKYKKKVIVEGEDMLTSGAYLIATAGDKIYVHKDTLTGSIGVILSSFGFSDVMQKLGVSRRVYTSGVNKDRLDPFLPENPEDLAKVKVMLNEVHQHFIDLVLTGRQGKLHGEQKDLFSGDFWTGTQAMQMGLVDGTGNTWDILQNEFGVEHIRNYTGKPSFLQSLFKEMGPFLNFKMSSDAPALKAQFGG